MLSNAYFLAKIGADKAESEQHFAEIFQNFGKMRGPGDEDDRRGNGARADARWTAAQPVQQWKHGLVVLASAAPPLKAFLVGKIIKNGQILCMGYAWMKCRFRGAPLSNYRDLF